MARLLLTLTVIVFTTFAHASGRLCVGSVCTDSSCGGAITTAEVARPFVLTARDGTSRVLGVIDSGAKEIVCTGSGVELRITSTSQRRQGANVVIKDSRDVQWEFPVSARELGGPLALRMPAGAYRLEIEAPHTVRHRSTFEVAGETTRVAARLVPLPVMTGVVREKATNRLLGGAVVLAGNGRDAVTDAAGRFSLELDPEEWPNHLTIDAAGFGRKTVAVPGPRVSASLDDIELSPAGAIVVRIEQSNPGEVLRVQLLKRTHAESTGGVVKSIDVAATDPAPVARFEALDPGHYVVLVQGDEPWERRGELVDIDGDTKELSVRITPFLVTLRAVMNGEPLRKASFRLRSREGLWSEGFESDGEGEAATQLWQGGRMVASVMGAAMNAPHQERRVLTEAVETEWHLVVPNHEISGVVLDSQTGEPVPNAAVVLNIRTPDTQLGGIKTSADEKGVFRFAPVPYGKHTLKAAAAAYPPREMTYTFLEPETSRNVVIRLDRASTVTLKVLDSAGAPVVGARVIDFRGLTRLGMTSTDPAGEVRIPVPEGEAHDVFVVPREGSFAFATVRSGADPVTLRVPPPSSRILVRTESTDKEPIPNVSVMVRYNGRVLPPELLEAMVTLHGSRANSDSQGRIVFRTVPSGLYEFWPVGSEAELRAVAAGAGPIAPAKLAAAPGENIAVLTFAAAP